ncbi:MAG: VWA domain-containing protein [Acidobacteriales bacterium]|nr:VWA domain-containing protein [Terriglobales bacterium]
MKVRTILILLTGILASGRPTFPALSAQDSELPPAPSAAHQQKTPPNSQQESQSPGQSTGSDQSKPSRREAQQPAPRSSPSPPPEQAQDAPQDDDSVARIVSVVNEVNVVFTVTDKHGRYVKDLEKSDFKVLDDGKPAQAIRSFHRETDLPLQVGLLVDASNSIRDRFKFEQDSAIEFLNQTVRPKYDQAFVVGFDVTPEVTQDFTDNTEALSAGVRGLRPGGGTAMYDALYFACRDKLLKAPHNGPIRRAVVLVSDGDDNQSHVTREEAIEMAQRAEVIVYTISTNVTGGSQRGDKVLERIAEATGGRSFFPFQIRDVANAFAEIQDELRSQYALSYKPEEFRADGRYHSIEILAVNHKSLHVRCRHGYFAPAH